MTELQKLYRISFKSMGSVAGQDPIWKIKRGILWRHKQSKRGSIIAVVPLTIKIFRQQHDW
ncbi:MAG: hypothetical protein ACLSEU_07115 [Streptococcus salivarius]